jgi:hypothetical protein
MDRLASASGFEVILVVGAQAARMAIRLFSLIKNLELKSVSI